MVWFLWDKYCVLENAINKCCHIKYIYTRALGRSFQALQHHYRKYLARFSGFTAIYYLFYLFKQRVQLHISPHEKGPEAKNVMIIYLWDSLENTEHLWFLFRSIWTQCTELHENIYHTKSTTYLVYVMYVLQIWPNFSSSIKWPHTQISPDMKSATLRIWEHYCGYHHVWLTSWNTQANIYLDSCHTSH